MRVLFVCTANKLRSPTAEDLFKDWPGLEVLSSGTDADSPRPLTNELVARADVIFAMETHHRDRIRKKFKQRRADNRIITLNIPDEYERGEDAYESVEQTRIRRCPLVSRAIVAQYT